MTSPSSRTSLLVGTVAVLLAATGAYLGLAGRDERAAWTRIDRSFTESRPATGRLTNWPYAPYHAPGAPSIDLAEARRFAQGIPPGSDARERLDGYLSLATGNWMAAAEASEGLLEGSPDDFRLTNDLGVIYLELGKREPAYLPEAFAKFQEAIQLDPRAPAPRFNLILAYEALHLDEDRKEAEAAYRSLDVSTEAPWLAELDAEPESGGDVEFSQALAAGNLGLARDMVREDKDIFWRFLSNNIVSPSEPEAAEPAFLLELAQYLEQTTGDATPRLMLEPLLEGDGQQVRTARQSIVRALSLLATGETASVLSVLEETRTLVAATGSQFDELWFKLNEAEVLTWSGNVVSGEQILLEVIDTTRSQGLKWLVADGLTRYSDQRYPASRIEFFRRLAEAVDTYDEIGAHTDSIRPRLFLSIYHQLEGSSQLAFEIALETLGLTSPTDIAARRNLFWLLNQIPLSQQRLQLAYAKEAAAHAQASGVPSSISQAHSRLAELYAEIDETERADTHLELAEEAASQLTGEARVLDDLANMLSDGKVLAMREAYDEAEGVFLEGLDLLPIWPTRYGSEYRLQLAKLYAGQGRDAEAREQFHLGLDAIETEDDLLGPEARLAFNEERRRHYEAAIAFEHSRGNAHAAWSVVQRYRNKLWADAFDRNAATEALISNEQIGSRIPEGGAIVEFTVLADQLLVWVTTVDGLDAASVPISRSELESSVRAIADLVRANDQSGRFERVSRQLYSTLIDPVEELLADIGWIGLVPDRFLHQLPFAALLDSEGRYLVERFSLVETPDVNYFFTVLERTTSSNRVAFGSRIRDRGTRTEIEGILQTYPGVEVFDSFDVTSDAVLDSIDGADFVVYAGHSAVDGADSLSSAILLDGVADSDNIVTALEIADRALAPNALVVLSSCDSAVGNNVGGIEFRGLTSGFLAAGAGSVVGSLWPVESMATANLMIDFHQRISRSTPVTSALAEAQRVMIRDGLHPFYWAAFAVTGNRTALEPAQFLDVTEP